MKAVVALIALALLPLALATPGCSTTDQFSVGSFVYLDKASYFSSGTFHLFVAVPSAASPALSNLAFKFAGTDGSACSGNTLGNWDNSTALPSVSDAASDACNPTVYHAGLSWANLHSSCAGVRDDSDATDLIWTFNLIVSFDQALTASAAADDQAFDFTRTIQSARRIIVRFPKYVEATTQAVNVTNVLANGRIPAQAALSKVNVDNSASAATNATVLKLEVLTAVTYPDVVTSATLESITAGGSAITTLGLDGTITSTIVDCSGADGSICKQKWSLTVKQLSDICGSAPTGSFTGTYKIKFNVACQNSYSYAPNCPTGTYFELDASIATANFCPIVRTAQLSATLAAANSAYRLRETVPFTLVASSSTATIKSTILVSVTLTQPYTPVDPQTAVAAIAWFTNKANSPAGTEAAFAHSNSEANGNNASTVTFSAKLLPKQIVLPSTSSRDIRVTAKVEVTFLNTESLGAPSVSRRLLTVEIPMNERQIKSLTSKGSDNLAASAVFNVDHSEAEKDEDVSAETQQLGLELSARASSAASVVFTPLAMLLSFVVALFNL